MAIVSAKEILIRASEGKYAVGAFNITNLVQMLAIVETATERKSPVIIQTSVSPTEFYKKELIVAIYRSLAEKAPVPVVLHLDHCNDVDFCKKCALAGYTNIMIDASKQSFEGNVQQTREVVEYCHSLNNVTVEGELGTVSGIEDQVKVATDKVQLCKPEEALSFIEQTGVDFLAPAIGTAHGIYATKDPVVDFDRLEKINQLINGRKVRIPLVIHGGSGLPQKTVQRLIALGGSKVNVSTELKHAYIDTSFDYIVNHRDEYEPGKVNKAVKSAIKKVVNNWIDVIGSADRY
ncbi:MAG: class II fructose-bisphosphate aldolase [Anaerolineaceae bacterium]